MEEESPPLSSFASPWRSQRGDSDRTMLQLPTAHYSGHVLAFLSVRDIVSFATTSRQALAASLPTLRRIQNSLFFDRALLLSASLSLSLSTTTTTTTTRPPLQHPPASCAAEPVHLSFTTLHERIQMLAELIPSKYSNRAKIQALRAALQQQLLLTASSAARRRRPERGTSSCCANAAAVTLSASGHENDDEYKNDDDENSNNCTARRIRELQSLMVPFRLLHQLTWSFSPVVRRRHREDDDDDDDDNGEARRTCSSSSSSSSGSCLLDDYLGDVYVVLYLLLSVSWSVSSSSSLQQRQQQQDRLHRIIGDGTGPSSPLPGQKRSNIDHNIGVDSDDETSTTTTITFARYGDWVYWHAQWLTKPELLTTEQRVRFGVWTATTTTTTAAMDRHEAERTAPPLPPPAVQRAMAQTTTTTTTTPPPSSVLTLVYDDFAPPLLGLPHFRGRDIVRMLDVSAAVMMMNSTTSTNDADASSSSSSSSTSLAVVREWIVSAHEQALSHRPMTVRPPEVRFG